MVSANLSFHAIEAIAWTLNGVAILLTAGRLYIRGKLIKHFHWDDAAHCLALLFSIVHIGTSSGATSLIADITNFSTGKSKVVPDWRLELQLDLVVDFSFFLCIWLVKLAFMLFYRTLFSVSYRFRTAWWIVLAFVLLTFWTCIAGTLIQCGGRPSHLLDISVCNSHNSIPLQRTIFKSNCAANVSSDFAIMLLPLGMLRRLQMRVVHKVGLAAIFGCSLIIVALELLRTIESLKGGATSLNTLWTNLETSIAVIVSCIPSYSTIFNLRRERKALRGNSARYSSRELTSRDTKAFGSSVSTRDLAKAMDDHEGHAVYDGSGDYNRQWIRMEPLQTL